MLVLNSRCTLLWTAISASRDREASIMNEMKEFGAAALHDVVTSERVPISCHMRTKRDPPSYGARFSSS